MGVRSGEQFFSSKWITAEIFDTDGRMWLVPIINKVGDYFLAEINSQIYAFKIENSRIKTWYTKNPSPVRSFRILLYTTAHYMPISPENNKGLELLLSENSLPKINRLMYNILSMLGKTEKIEKFVAHDLNSLITELENHPEKEDEVHYNILQFLKSIGPKQINTPVKDLTDFLQQDLIATDPKFLGSIPETVINAEVVHRKVTNAPIGAKKGWVKWMLIILVIGMIGFMAVYFFSHSSGGNPLEMFSHVVPGLNPGLTPEQIMAQYPNPEALKTAIDRGEIKYDSLPGSIKDMLNSYKPPTVTPKENIVKLTP